MAIRVNLYFIWIDLNLLKPKSITFTHEYMYSRPLHETEDMTLHRDYLTDISEKISIFLGPLQTNHSQRLKGVIDNQLNSL